MSAALELLQGIWAEGLRMERRLTVSEWADTYRELTSISSRDPGRWRTSRTPYLGEIMDELSPQSPTENVVVMKGAQLGGTEAGNNWIGYSMHRNPGPMLMVLPTIEFARKVSKQRIAPMIRATKVLRERVREARSRDSGNTLLVKEYDGGVFLMAGANSSAGLRSMPIRDLFRDEIDAYPSDVDGQGDPLELAEERTNTYEGIRKILDVSTPTVRGISKIEKRYLERSDQRRYLIPCPLCGHMDFLTWTGRDWIAEDEEVHHRIVYEPDAPETAHMRCSKCDREVAERHKNAILRAGEWRQRLDDAGRPLGDGKTAGFHISALYSPQGWRSWATCAEKFMIAKEDPAKLKTWVNTTLGETWEERGDSVEPHMLRKRVAIVEQDKPGWPARGMVPNGAGVLVAAVDVQSDRLEVLVKAYGIGEESWLVDTKRIDGDPSTAEPWFALDRYLAQEFEHSTSGRQVKIERTVVDSGGLHTEEVYKYCKARISRGVFAVKGGSISGRPLVQRPTTTNRYRVPLFVLCVDTGKEIVLSRLHMRNAGPGYIHIPQWVDDEYLEQLTAEKGVRKYLRGRGWARVWVQMRPRNEALDLEVYALAAFYIMGGERLQLFLRDMAARVKALAEPTGEKKLAAPGAPTLREPGKMLRGRPRRGWVDRWRE